MRIGNIRFLFDYDQWATKRVMDAALGLDEAAARAVAASRAPGGAA